MRGSIRTLLLLAATLGPAQLEAQTASSASPSRPMSFGPALGQAWKAGAQGLLSVVTDTAFAARLLMSPATASLAGRREGRALMIVGGAGILAGLILNEGIVVVAGAGAAGVGLYLYLR